MNPLSLSLFLITLLSFPIPSLQEKNIPTQWLETSAVFYSQAIQVSPALLPEIGFPFYRGNVILCEAMYDTWVAYTQKGKSTSGVTTIARTNSTSTSDIEEALSYAAHRTLSSVYGYVGPSVQQSIDNFLVSLGYPLRNSEFDLTNNAGVGNTVAERVLEWRSKDRSNAKGDEPSSNGIPYSDYTYYAPRNDPLPQVGISDCDKVRFINNWQPARFYLPDSSTEVQRFSIIGWSNLRAFSFENPNEFLAPPPSGYGTLSEDQWRSKLINLINISASLDDYQKALAWYWAFIVPPSIYLGDIAETLNLDLENSIKLFLVVWETAVDALVVELYNKRFYDHARPLTAIQCTFKDELIYSWQGPYLGTGLKTANTWRAYLPDTVVTFTGSEYISGGTLFVESVFTAIKLFTNTEDYVGPSYTMTAGSHPLEPKIDDPSDPNYVAGLTDVPNTGPGTPGYVPARDIVFDWDKWDDLGKSMADSRTYLGIHFRPSVDVAVDIGKRVATRVVKKAREIFSYRKNSCQRFRK
eukprot:TRINITY_DN700_c0_g2_i2.p1 TRINITY_DN700_c0_g2~~TRINITY_DN700_c0_g2_i2.p1  ORF type:complete len:525 (+),score=83.28 TRINITY_DN700_c0_g2_i2:65-1639(+)